MGAQVTHFSTLQGIKAGSKSYLTSETALRYLANFGAVLNPIGLNLNRGKSKENVSKTADKILYALLIVALLVTVGWTAWVLIIYYGKVAERDLLNAEIQKMEPIETLKAEYDAVVAEHAAYIAFDTATISENEQLLKFITDLERILPKDLIVNDLVATDGVVKFSVKAPNKEAVADMYVAVSELPYVKDVVLPSYMEEVGVIPSWEAELDDEGNVISLNGEEYVVDEEAVDYTYGGGITFVTYEFQCTLYGEVPAATTQEGGAQ